MMVDGVSRVVMDRLMSSALRWRARGSPVAGLRANQRTFVADRQGAYWLGGIWYTKPLATIVQMAGALLSLTAAALNLATGSTQHRLRMARHNRRHS
jgi:hypothetical protein